MNALLGAGIVALALFGAYHLTAAVVAWLRRVYRAIYQACASALRRQWKWHRKPDTDSQALLHLAITGLIDALAAHNARMVASPKDQDQQWYVDQKETENVKEN